MLMKSALKLCLSVALMFPMLFFVQTGLKAFKEFNSPIVYVPMSIVIGLMTTVSVWIRYD